MAFKAILKNLIGKGINSMSPKEKDFFNKIDSKYN